MSVPSFQSYTGPAEASTSSTTIALSSLSTTAGRLYIAVVKWEGSSTTVTGADGGSNTWTEISGCNVYNGTGSTGTTMLACIADTTTTVTLTATFGTAVTWRKLAVSEYTTSWSDYTVHDTATGTGFGLTLSAGDLTTSGNDVLLVCGAGLSGSRTTTAGSIDVSWNLRSSGNTAYSFQDYGAASVTGPVEAENTLSGTKYWAISAATLIENAGGGGSSIPLFMHHYKQLRGAD